MENIIIKLANAHRNQLRDFEVKREIKSVQEYINSLKLRFDDNTVCLVCLRGYYDDFTKKTILHLFLLISWETNQRASWGNKNNVESKK